MTGDRELVETQNVSMYPSHWATVRQFAKDQGYGNTSAALRRIIDEWRQMKANCRDGNGNGHDVAPAGDN